MSLNEILNIPHFKKETIEKIDSYRKNKIEICFNLSNFSNQTKSSLSSSFGHIDPVSRAENFLSINIAKLCSNFFNHEEIIPWDKDSFFFDYFKLFESKPLFVNDEKINIKIKFKEICIEYNGLAKCNKISQCFLIGDLKKEIHTLALEFVKDTNEIFYISIQLETPDSLSNLLKLDDGFFWENIFLKDLKINNLPEDLNLISKESVHYLNEYNLSKELDKFYQIKLSLNAKSF